MGTTPWRALAPPVLAALVAGCGPAYRTVYDYSPPHEQSAAACIGGCESTQRDCDRAIAAQSADCTMRAQAAYQDCARARDRDYNVCLERQRAVPSTICVQSVCILNACDTQSARCTDDYNRCYENCGGTVTPRQECTANCPEEH